MEPIEKIERLRESADVSFEDARIALEENNWDLLDAAKHLEEQGIKVGPMNSTKSTENTEIPPLPSVKKVVETNKENYAKEEQISEKLKRGFRKVIHFIRSNSVKVERAGNEIFSVPLLAVVILFLLSWKLMLLAFVISLFFNVRYSFFGKNNLSKANDVMDKASDVAQRVKDEFRKL